MTGPKTVPNTLSVAAFLDGIENAERQSNSRTLCALMERITGQPPTMWGPSIIGFGSRHYRYESGREGDTVAVGFSPRKQNLALYGVLIDQNRDSLARLGPHTTGKGCLYLKRLSGIDLQILEEMVLRAFRHKQT